MRTITLRRKEMTDAGTFGVLEGISRGDSTYHTGELPWLNNAAGKSCVPAGRYLVKWSPSGKYGHKYQLQDVPGRTHILLHAANFCGAEDKGLRADLDGCIALGATVNMLEGQRALRGSKLFVECFEDELGREDFELIILDEWLEAGEPYGALRA